MLKRNLIANYLGQGWTALMGIVFVPLYIKYLGIEAYGLIGLFAVLQAWLGLLDVGMSPTLNREMARLTAGAHTASSIRDLLRSIEIVAIAVAVFVALCIWAASDWLASDWLQAEKLPADVVAQALAIMGVVTALRFVESIYRSSLLGLQRQVLFNIVSSVLATLRGLGAVGILAWVSSAIEAFFIWQGVVSILTLGILRNVTYGALPEADRAGRFSANALRGIGRFAGGVIGINFLALLLTQVDKILLSRLLTLSEYGYYTLATTVAGTLYMINGPIAQAWFPRLSELCAANDTAELINKFHQGAQLVSVLMGSAAFIMIAFAEVLLQLWTHDAELAHRSAYLLSILALGTLLNGLMWIPYQTQLAHGWTRIAFWINVVSVAVIVPAILWATPRYGAIGAAWAWVVLNAGYVLIGIHFMFRKILKQEKWRWYCQDLLLPLTAAGLVVGAFAWGMPSEISGILQLVWVVCAIALTLLAATMAASALRGVLWAHGRKYLNS